MTLLKAIVIILIAWAFLCLSSCASQRNGYGCHGNQSWGKMVRRINSQ